MRYKILISAALLFTVLLSVGCGSDTGTTQQTAQTTAETTTVTQTTTRTQTTTEASTEKTSESLTEIVASVAELTKKPVVKTTKKPVKQTKTTTTTTQKVVPTKITHDGYTKQQVVDYFEKTAFGSEDGGYIDRICKRTSKIYYYLGGNCLNEDVRTIEKIAAQLNQIEGFPGIEPTDDLNKANMTFVFSDSVTLASLVDGYSVLDNGYCKCALGDNYEITNALIAVNNTMILRKERDTVIMEEMLQSLGLANDSPDYEESLFYDGWSIPAKPAEIDWALVKLLYHPSIKVGMSKAKAMQVVWDLLA